MIADAVVAQTAGIAARAVPGVYALGGGGARVVGAVREAVTSTNLAQGVTVTVDEMRASVEVVFVVEYPAPVRDVADSVRAAVADAITTLVGMDVLAVNITVDDMHVETATPDDNQSGPA